MLQTQTSRPIYSILVAVSFAHLLNDLIQGVLPAVYPLLKEEHNLDYGQIGLITFVYQMSASIFQPMVGAYTDKRSHPFSQMLSMGILILGLLLFANAHSYMFLLFSVFLVGIASSVFHPESSRIAYMASSGQRSLAQSIFQIGGNAGMALAPIAVAYIVLPRGQWSLMLLLVVPIIGQFVAYYIGAWYKKRLKNQSTTKKKIVYLPDLPPRKITTTVVILLLLILSKYFYVASITNFLQFYTIEKFSISVVQSQVYLFYFLIAIAVGTMLGGFFGDRFGRKYVIWFSVLGAAPFTLALPYVGLTMTAVFIVIIGIILSSAFPAIIVYAQELLPKKLGMVSGLFYGFAFGMAGMGSAILGCLADKTSIAYIYHICSYLPLIGIVAALLPNLQRINYIEEKVKIS
ncbi:FSR family fosmidomycin resistance protein-like MFS transporter [Sphingobacterium alimentarium]|uniref:FSR family fosmidomycin resistance protein-like MFS transporter n=1 Tax=Sphingobacterium alimentarium TaxID=797292 RepID=A0A4R3VUW1_9SPHI|nr:MFS transporter [Sphingobacterium alimentarium]TCV18734.1 FSR family fosmidomycin resistance protein-like MFS transporter [Sphingobacterium alimentarium]